MNCLHWSECGIDNNSGGCCGKNLFGGRPSVGICLRVCKEREEQYPEEIKEEIRPLPTVEQVSTFAKAMLTGKYVSLEILKERKETCQKCDHVRRDGDVPWCGICGCKVSGEHKKIDNLAAYEENLPSWGCKHPGRQSGLGGWKR